MKALVLTAGKSTRIAPVSKGVPKPLLRIDGRSVIEHNLLWLKSFGIRDIWINLHYRPEDIKKHLGDGSRLGVEIRYSFEEEILGTAGAIKKLEAECDEMFLVVYGDNFFNFNLAGLLEAHDPQESLVTIALFSMKEHLNSGIAGGRVKVDGGRVVAFIEGDSAYDLVNAGCYVCNPELCNHISAGRFCDFSKDLFPKLLDEGRMLGAHLIDGYCLGLDDPASYERVRALLGAKEIM
ncbi:MAG: nucleotidyltransferase family protein [Actinobacteria bacterium]|nr:nucleotidyltransferase family protein [Actinomycetota bacterium]